MDSFVTRNPPPSKEDDLKSNIQKAELKLCACLAAHDLSFEVMEHLVPCIKSCFTDSEIAQGISLKRRKATRIVVNAIRASEKKQQTVSLQKRKFSVLVDESTDIAATKTLAIVVRFFDTSKGRIVTRFVLKLIFCRG